MRGSQVREENAWAQPPSAVRSSKARQLLCTYQHCGPSLRPDSGGRLSPRVCWLRTSGMLAPAQILVGLGRAVLAERVGRGQRSGRGTASRRAGIGFFAGAAQRGCTRWTLLRRRALGYGRAQVHFLFGANDFLAIHLHALEPYHFVA